MCPNCSSNSGYSYLANSADCRVLVCNNCGYAISTEPIDNNSQQVPMSNFWGDEDDDN